MTEPITTAPERAAPASDLPAGAVPASSRPAIAASAAWVTALEPGAPDIVAAWRGIDERSFLSVRRQVRRRVIKGSAGSVAAQLAVMAAAVAGIVDGLSDDDLGAPGGEEDWSVAQAIGHACDARAGLALAASRAARGTFPSGAPRVVPGVPGPADADRETLLRKIGQSQRLVERCAATVVGHETDPCPLEHPLVGRLRCGEWLLFAGVHDLMHLEQLHVIVDARTGRVTEPAP